MVGIQVGYLWYEIGTPSFLKSWFSSINYHLKDENWGTVYPIIMNEFYQGKVPHPLVIKLREDIIKTREKLRSFKPSQVIWDIDNLEKNPPWGDTISNHIESLGDYYVTCNGEDLYEVILLAIDASLEDYEDIFIKEL